MQSKYIVASDLMVTPVITIGPDAAVTSASTLMLERQVGCLVVVDDVGLLKGIITDRDILHCIAENHVATHCTVSSHMTKSVYTATIEAPIMVVVQIMAEKNVKRIPIYSVRGLEGIISFTDISDALSELMDEIWSEWAHAAKSMKSSARSRR